MIKFADFVTTLDKDIKVEIYSALGEIIYNGRLRNLKVLPEKILRIIPKGTSKEIYLEITVY